MSTGQARPGSSPVSSDTRPGRWTWWHPFEVLVPGTIRGKLFLALGVIVFNAAIGVVMTWSANRVVERQITAIADDNLPALVIAHRFSERMTNIASVAAALANAETASALESREAVLAVHVTEARETAAALEASGVRITGTPSLQGLVDQVDGQAQELATRVEERLLLDNRVGATLRTLAESHAHFTASVEPLVERKLAQLERETGRILERTDLSLDTLNAISFKGLIPALSMRVQVGMMRDALLATLDASDPSAIDNAWSEFVAASAVAGRNLQEMREDGAVSAVIDVAALGESYQAALAYGIGDASLFERQREVVAAGGTSDPGLGARVQADYSALERQLGLSVTQIRGRAVTLGTELNREVGESLAAIDEATIVGYGSLLEMEALGNSAVGILSLLPFVEQQSTLEPLREELVALLDDIALIGGRASDDADLQSTAESAVALVRLGLNENGLIALRQAELLAFGDVERLLTSTNSLTQRMRTIAADIVTSEQRATEAAAAAVRGSLERSRLTIGVTGVMLLAAMLGTVLYVNRRLGARLSAFSNSALSLAEGNIETPLPQPSGADEISRLMRALSVFRDTAAEVERQNLREIAEARQRLDEALESISEGFALFDPQERLVIANRRYAEIMLGPGADALRSGVPFGQMIAAAAEGAMFPQAREDDTWVDRQLSRFRSTSAQFMQHMASGQWHQVGIRKTESGGTVVLVSDISEIKRISDELQHAKNVAEAANEAKSTFLATMSHEIRTPLNGVVGMSKLLMGTRLDSEQQDFAATIVDASETLIAIVNDILDFSKVEAGALELEALPLDVLETAEAAAELVAGRAAEKDVDLVCRVAADVPRGIVSDPTRLKQVLMNLLNNAVKFTEEGSVTLDVSRGRDDPPPTGRVMLSFAVRDTGIGIPADRMDRLFRSFSQVDASTTRQYGGTGLGLAICQRLVGLMGGEISVESEVGRGSTFSFEITVETADLPDETARAERMRMLQGTTALVIEQAGPHRASLVERLGTLGVSVVACDTAEDAATHRGGVAHFDVVLIDRDSAGDDWQRTASTIRAMPQGHAATMIMVAAMTAVDSAFWEQVNAVGFSSILTKPAKTSQLLNTLLSSVSRLAGIAETERQTVRQPEAVPISILLVDDNRINRKVGMKVLKKLGYTAELAESGPEAIDCCDAVDYDVVLMDIEMPGMDGLEAAAKIREHAREGRRPFIIALTANAMVSDRESYLSAGMDDYLSKPIDETALAESLRRAANSKAIAPVERRNDV